MDYKKNIVPTGPFTKAIGYIEKLGSTEIAKIYQFFENPNHSGDSITMIQRFDLEGHLLGYQIVDANKSVEEFFRDVILRIEFQTDNVPSCNFYEMFLLNKLPVNVFGGFVDLNETTIQDLREREHTFADGKDYKIFLALHKGHTFALVIPQNRERQAVLLESSQLLNVILDSFKERYPHEYELIKDRDAKDVFDYIHEHHQAFSEAQIIRNMRDKKNQTNLIYFNCSLQKDGSCSLFASIFLELIAEKCRTYDDFVRYIQTPWLERDTLIKLAQYGRQDLYKTTNKSTKMLLGTNPNNVLFQLQPIKLDGFPITVRAEALRAVL